MYDRIVIPVDGSDPSGRALRRGLELAKAFDATAEALHVVPSRLLGLARTPKEEARLRERGEAILAEAAEVAAEVGQPVRTELAEGRPAERIHEYADDRDALLIVLGRQGATGIGKRLLGGVAEQVLHRCDVPVLVVPGGNHGKGSDGGYSRVLVPTDGSENARRAVQHGAAIAGRYGATLHALYVVDVQAAAGAFDAGGVDRAFVERLEARGEAAVGGVAEEVGETAPEVDVETAVVEATSFGGVASGIREYVADHDVDIVVMGSHGRSNLRGQVLGSVTSALLRTVDVPVLVVKRPRDAAGQVDRRGHRRE